MGQIRSLRHTAIARNCESCHVDATGYNARLNKIINETLARNGKSASHGQALAMIRIR